MTVAGPAVGTGDGTAAEPAVGTAAEPAVGAAAEPGRWSRPTRAATARLLASLAAGAVLAWLAVLPLSRGGFHAYGLGQTAATAVVLALSLQVCYGLGGLLSVAQAPLQGVGAYAVAILMADHGWTFWPTVPVAVGAAAVVGALVGSPVLRVRGDVLALVTLGAGEILQSVYLHAGITGGYTGIPYVPSVRLFGTRLGDRGDYLLSLGLAAVAFAVVVALLRSPLGRAWAALRDDEVGARAFGLRPGRLRLLAFTVGSGLAGLAGALFTVDVRAVSSVSFGLQQSVQVILVVLVAGQARLGRTVLAAVGLVLVEDRLAGIPSVSEGLTGGLILVVVAARLGLPAVVAVRARSLLARLRPAPVATPAVAEGSRR